MKQLAILVAVILAVSGIAQTGSGGYGANSSYNKLWNGAKRISINGKVTGKIVAPPMEGLGASVALMVKQSGKPAYEVQLGPSWYVSHMARQVNTGDSVTVLGSWVTLKGRPVIMAQVVTIGKTDITFRAKTGTPMWVGVTPLATEPNGQSGTVVDTGTVVINGVEYTTYQIDTGSGTIDIVGAPTWYTARQDFVLDTGNNVRIVGPIRPVQIAPNLFIADSIFAAGSTIVLRPWWFR